MYWILILLVIFLLLYKILHKGKLAFWKFVAKHPDEAYSYFKQHSNVWMVIDVDPLKDINKYLRNKDPDFKNQWVGPFRLYVPSLANVIQIFGRADSYEEEQERLMRTLIAKEKSILEEPHKTD